MKKMVYTALVGSHNYNLSVKNSDKDYIQFNLPGFDDLYRMKFNSSFHPGKDKDITIHDIRRFPSFIYKSNVNFVEVLFSIEQDVGREEFNEIIAMRDRLARINLPYLYNSSRGLAYEMSKELYRAPGGKFNPKKAYGILRIYSFIIRYHANGFKSYQEAIWNETGSKLQKELMLVRTGDESEKRYLEMRDELFPQVEALRESYESVEPDDEALRTVEDICKRMVYNHIREEFLQHNL